jgi:PAS domain S-box-containing protein
MFHALVTSVHASEQREPSRPAAGAETGFLAGGGEMGARMRAVDWDRTPLGPAQLWPQSLRTSISTCLSCAFPILLWWGPELVMLYNDEYIAMLGAKHPAALGMRGADCWPEIWDVIGPMLGQVLTRGQATRSRDLLLVLERNFYPEECYFSFSYSPIHDESGGIGGVFTPVIETTAKVIGERRLRTLRDLAAPNRGAPDVAATLQRAAAVLADNPRDLPFAALYLIGPTRAEARLAASAGLADGGGLCPDAASLAGGASWLSAAMADAAAGTARIIEIPAACLRDAALTANPWPDPPKRAIVLPVTPPGQTAPASLLIAGLSPRLTLEGAYREFLTLATDRLGMALADTMAHEEERRRAAALAELDRAKTAFFTNVSHEFRTPLTLVLGPLEELLADPALATTARARVEMAHRNGRRLLRLVGDMLDFARLEAGRARAHFVAVDLARLTADLASGFRSLCARAGLSLEVACPPLPAAIPVDRAMWEKIVLNLLSNAFKFTHEGAIRVALRPAADAPDMVELVVEDTGIGIAAADLAHIFERFHRVEQARGRSHEGAGIGLTLVREAVRLHGGETAVRSAPGSGTTVTVRIPMRQATTVAEAPAPAGAEAAYLEAAASWLPDEIATVPAPPEGRPRVLVVDDNADMRAYIHRVLGADYAVDLVADGDTAIARARARPPDLVLADVMMPGLDGIGLVASLRAEAGTASVPVILLSARAGAAAGSAGLEAGADDYVVKPFAAQELRARVAACLRATARERRLRLDAQTADARTALALRAARIVAWDHDIATGQTFRSEEAASLLGLRSGPPEQFYALLHPQDRARVLAAGHAALRHGTAYQLEYRVITADGREVWLSDTAEPRHAPDGTLAGITGVMTDITARKQAEAAHRRQQARDSLLLALGDRLRDAASPAAVMQAAATALGRHLAASGAGYAEVEQAGRGRADYVIIEADWRAAGFPGVGGRYRLDDYAPALKQALRDGQCVVVADTETRPEIDAAGRAAYAAARVRAVIEQPLVVDGHLHAALFVVSEQPRVWTAEEVALAGEVAERSWAAVRRMRAEHALRASEERLRQLADNIREVFYVADPRRDDMEYVSSAYERVWGLPAAALYERRGAFLDGVHPGDRAQVRAAMVRQIAGEPTEVRYRLVRPDGAGRRIWDRAWPLRDASGTVYRIVGVAEDETERAGLLESLAAERSLLRAVFDAAPVGIMVAEAPSGRIIETNRRAGEMSLLAEHPAPGVDRPPRGLAFHPDGRQVAESDYPLTRVLSGGEERPELEVLQARADGGRVWVRLAAAPVRDAAGAVVGGVVAALDIDRERRAIAALEVAMERQRALIDELNHRVKNTLAVVQSLAHQTVRSALGLADFTARFGSRLQGLARAHDVLTRQAWEGATLADVAQAALGPWLSEGRIVLAGDAARLSPKQALALSMAFGELATNAARHGALSVPTGRVALTCRLASGDGAGERRILLDWVEQGGPPVQPPERRGLGSRLLGRPLAAELCGTLDLLFDPAGVRCLFRFDASQAPAIGGGVTAD